MACTAESHTLEGQQQYPLSTRQIASLLFQWRILRPVDTFVEPAFYSVVLLELLLSIHPGIAHLRGKTSAVFFHLHRKLQTIQEHALSTHQVPAWHYHNISIHNHVFHPVSTDDTPFNGNQSLQEQIILFVPQTSLSVQRYRNASTYHWMDIF